MDPAHVPYAHKGIMRGIRKKEDPGRYVPDLTRVSSLMFGIANEVVLSLSVYRIRCAYSCLLLEGVDDNACCLAFCIADSCFFFFTVEYDKEGGGPVKMKIEQANIEGFVSPQERGYFQFVAPCTVFGAPFPQEV